MSNFVLMAERPVSEKGRVDSIFLMLTLLLWGLGLYTQFVCTQEKALSLHFSSKYYFFFHQLMYSVPAFFVFIVTAAVPVKYIRKSVLIFTFLFLILCLVPIFKGVYTKGAVRWINIGSFSFQPSEFVKFFIVLYLSHIFVKHFNEYEKNQREFFYPLLVLFLFVGVVFLQKDFSTAVLIFLTGTCMFIICGASVGWLALFGLLAIPAGAFMVLSEEYRLFRVISFLHPERYEDSYAFQLLKSKNAIRAGGFWGTGMGTGMNLVPSIPEVQSDYIFAGFANSMGLLGVTAYIVILILFCWRGFKIAFNCPNKFAAYSSFGLVFTILLQSLANIAVVSGSIPTTGIPLPFFSAGGSSLISTMMMCGFILNASHCAAEDEGEYSFDLKSESEKDDDSIESFNGVVVENE